MSWIAATDPLALVAIAAGQVPTPSSETGAAGGGKLDTPQRAVELGEPVPIVFARRRNSKGGVLISPGATEARFENDANNAVTAWYHLVLSEGQIDSIPVKDVFQRSCRVGSHSQTYNRRAGTWAPGNAIVARQGYDMPECPYYCGTVGAYPGISTLSFTNTIPNGFDQWNRQVHCFIRGGMHVTRLNDSVSGPSDSFADLVLWMLTNSGRVPSALIDTTALTAADLFLEENGFTCNCWITDSQNYGDLLAKWAPYFLLGESNNGGKKGLRPLLPVTETGAIDTGTISWEYAFNEDTIIPGSLEIQYTSLADRLPFVAQITWRQQLEDDFGIIRTAEVRYDGTAETGPYESHDLSAFCTSEDHAVKVGAYLLAKRVYTTHTIRFSARPQAHNTLLSPGDIVRVTLDRTATAAAPTQHDYLYQVERISKTLAGDVSYECTHFPVDADGKSLIALDVAAATGTGILLTSNKTGVGCDVNSYSDNTIPDETWSTATDLGVEEVTLELAAEETPQRTGTFSFTDVTVEATDDPNVWTITVSATCDPPPINTSDGIEEDNVPPGPEDQLSITLNNGHTFYIPPIVEPATTVQGQLIFDDDVSNETLPVTRTLSVTSWSGGGFDVLDTTDTIQYEISAGSVYRIQADVQGGTPALVAPGLTLNGTLPVSATGGPFNDAKIAPLPNTWYDPVSVTSEALAAGLQDFTLEQWVKVIYTKGNGYREQFWVVPIATPSQTWATTGHIYLYIAVQKESDAWVEFGERETTATIEAEIGNGIPWMGTGSLVTFSISDYDRELSVVNSWCHLAICRSGGQVGFYVNGQAVEQASSMGNIANWSMGDTELQLLQDFVYIDPDKWSPDPGNVWGVEFGQSVFTIGTAKYTGNFTPPAQRI